MVYIERLTKEDSNNNQGFVAAKYSQQQIPLGLLISSLKDWIRISAWFPIRLTNYIDNNFDIICQMLDYEKVENMLISTSSTKLQIRESSQGGSIHEVGEVDFFVIPQTKFSEVCVSDS